MAPSATCVVRCGQTYRPMVKAAAEALDVARCQAHRHGAANDANEPSNAIVGGTQRAVRRDGNRTNDHSGWYGIM